MHMLCCGGTLQVDAIHSFIKTEKNDFLLQIHAENAEECALPCMHVYV